MDADHTDELRSTQQRTLDRAQLKSFDEGRQTGLLMSPEDVVLYKLEWYMMGKSEKHLRDIGIMLTHQQTNFDFDYLNQYVDEVNAREIWHDLENTYRQQS